MNFVDLQMSLANFAYCRVCFRAQWTREDPRLFDDSLLNMGKHVGALSFNIWKNMQAHVKHSELGMDCFKDWGGLVSFKLVLLHLKHEGTLT